MLIKLVDTDSCALITNKLRKVFNGCRNFFKFPTNAFCSLIPLLQMINNIIAVFFRKVALASSIYVEQIFAEVHNFRFQRSDLVEDLLDRSFGVARRRKG